MPCLDWRSVALNHPPLLIRQRPPLDRWRCSYSRSRSLTHSHSHSSILAAFCLSFRAGFAEGRSRTVRNTHVSGHRPSVPTVWKMTRWEVDSQSRGPWSSSSSWREPLEDGLDAEQGGRSAPSFLASLSLALSTLSFLPLASALPLPARVASEYKEIRGASDERGRRHDAFGQQ